MAVAKGMWYTGQSMLARTYRRTCIRTSIHVRINIYVCMRRSILYGWLLRSFILPLFFLCSLFSVSSAIAQPYYYRADGVRGAQFLTDLSFLLGLEVKSVGNVVGNNNLVGEFSGDSRRKFLNDLSRTNGFAWAIAKNKLTLSSRTSLLTRSYRFSSSAEYLSFRSRLRQEGIDGGPLLITPLRGGAARSDSSDDTLVGEERVSDVFYDIQAIEAFHESAETIYVELSGEDQNRLLSPSNSVIYPIAGERFALMIFRLQYAWADDTRVGGDSGGSLLPGVAGLMEKVVAARYGKSAPRQVSSSSAGSIKGLVGDGLQKINELGLLPKKLPQDGVPSNSVASPRAGSSSGGGGSAVVTSGQPLSIGSNSSPLIFADPRQNAVVIFDDRSRYGYYRRLISELDSRTRLVKIEAAIVDISKSKVSDLGIQWQGQHGDSEASFGSIAAGAASGALSFATGGLSLSNNAIISNVNGLIARINILENSGKGRVVSRPSILTLDNIEASLTSSEKFFVRVEAFQDSSLYPVEVSTTLKVTPHIIREGKKTRIKLLVVIKDGSIDQTTSANVDGLPRITTNSLTTQAEILETQALVIGGHIRSEVSVSKRRVPLLGYIPILGLPFKHSTKRKQDLVRLYIIRPRLTLPADDMGEAQAVIGDNDLFAYPELLQKERVKALKRKRKRELKESKRAKKAAKKIERQRLQTARKATKDAVEDGGKASSSEPAQSRELNVDGVADESVSPPPSDVDTSNRE